HTPADDSSLVFCRHPISDLETSLLRGPYPEDAGSVRTRRENPQGESRYVSTRNDSHRPRVSVVIPTYNRAHLITSALDTVFAQTYPNIEVVVVDDGSTDQTRARLERYGDRVTYVYQRNAGVAIARNTG